MFENGQVWEFVRKTVHYGLQIKILSVIDCSTIIVKLPTTNYYNSNKIGDYFNSSLFEDKYGLWKCIETPCSIYEELKILLQNTIDDKHR